MQAVLLAAGGGTRLRDVAPVKPLARVAGRPLVAHALERLAAAGVDDAIVVLGYEAAAVAAAIEALPARRCRVRTVVNPDWQAPNGVSVLAAAPFLGKGRPLLAMCDHLVDPQIYAQVAAAAGDATVLGIDRRVGHAWVDEDDVTRVATSGDRIVAIGKLIEPYDAYDTGVFAITPALLDRLAALPSPSLSDGMRALAAKGLARAVDIGDKPWLDVDDARALAIAEDWLCGSGVAGGAAVR